MKNFYKNLSVGLLTMFVSTCARGQVTCLYGCQSIVLKHNSIIITSETNGNDQSLLLGTGNITSQIFASENARPTGNKKFQIKNNLISADNIKFSVDDRTSHIVNCHLGPYVVEGIYAADLLGRADAYMIDFDNLNICNLRDADIGQMVLNGNFKEVKSRFKNGIVEISVSINWKEYHFIFDTSYQGYFQLPFNPRLSFLKDHHSIWINSEGPKAAESYTYLYSNKGVWMDGTGYNSTISVESKNLHASVGMSFIRGFNWIIDNRNRKVYYKKNTLSLENGYNRSDYILGIDGRSLTIVARKFKKNGFSIGSRIESVFGEKVGTNNICDFYDLLTSNEDWAPLNVEIGTGKKD